MPLRHFIQSALAGENLSYDQAREAMGHVMRGDATAAQIAAWLVAMRIKRETVAELTGFASAMRDAMVPLPDAPDGAIDTCGTGGDGLGTFNISTAAALITAACGVPVAKHGNRAVSSQSGSADVLAALGFDIDPGIERVSHALKQTGFAFMFAPRFHPAMKHAAVPRKEIGVRTVFNMLGPLCNPALVRRQIIGVFDRSRAREIAEVLAALGAEHALVVSGPNGADELLPTGDNLIVEWDGKRITEQILTVKDIGIRHCTVDDLLGGDAERSASIIRAIAEGAHGPKRETAVLNAAAALYVADEAESIAEGIGLAHTAIHEGRVLDLLHRAAEASRSAN